MSAITPPPPATCASELVLRLYLCLSTLVVSFISLYNPQSLNAQLIAAAGMDAYIVSAALVAAACVGLADLLVNDLLPVRWTFGFAWRHREMGYVAIASLNLAFVFAVARTDHVTWFAARYALDASACVFVAWHHVRRHQASHNYPHIERRKGRP